MKSFIQHIAFGVENIDVSHRFYRDLLGFRIKVIDTPGFPIPVTPLDRLDKDEKRIFKMRIIFAFHPNGGAALELAQFEGPETRKLSNPICPGDRGFTEIGIRVNNLPQFLSRINETSEWAASRVFQSPWMDGKTLNYAYLRDPDGLLLRLVEISKSGPPCALGVNHLGVGVSNIKECHEFYSGVLGIGGRIHEWEETIPAMEGFTKHPVRLRNVYFGTGTDRRGRIRIPNQSSILLMEPIGYEGVNIAVGRRWGDIGIMELALDVDDIDSVICDLSSTGCHVSAGKEMIRTGPGSYGYFAFITDPFDNLIELVDIRSLFYLPPVFTSGFMYGAVMMLDKIRPSKFDLSWLFKLNSQAGKISD